MTVDIDLSGRTAIVTGAGRGIGEGIAGRLAEAGANVVAAARTTDEIEAVVEAVEAEHGVEGLAVRTDLTDVDDVQTLVDESVDAFGVPEILVNNAGANLMGDPMEHSVQEVDTMLDVNVRGTFLLTQRWGRAYRDAGLDWARVVNVSSVVAEVGTTPMALYGGTKAGVRGLTKGFAAALGGDGVTVNSVSPGITRVGRTAEAIESGAGGFLQLDRIPVGRAGEPADVADVCAFLASPQASYVTGVDVLVDGGVAFTAGLYGNG